MKNELGALDLLNMYGATLALKSEQVVEEFVVAKIRREANWLAPLTGKPEEQIIRQITFGYVYYDPKFQRYLHTIGARHYATMTYRAIRDTKSNEAAKGVSEPNSSTLADLGAWYVLSLRAFYALNQEFGLELDIK